VEFGPFYELRSYRIKLNGLMPTMGKWERGPRPQRLFATDRRDVLARRQPEADAALALPEP